MPRQLKQSFPCKRCGVPCRVKSRAAGARALCPSCMEFRRLSAMLAHRDREARLELNLAEKVNPEREPNVYAEHWLRAFASFLEGAADAMCATTLPTNGKERLRLYRYARARLEWVQGRADKLDPWMDHLLKVLSWPSMEVIDGEGQPPQPPSEADPARPPVREPLQLVVSQGDE